MVEEREEELFDEDLEEVLEDEELEEDFDEEELDEKNEEGESEKEIKNVRVSRLNEFLANPWKDVSLNQRESAPVISLEMNFDSGQKEEDFKNEKISYMPKLGEEINNLYQQATIQGKMEDKFISEAEKILEEQKKIYFAPQNLMSGMGEIREQEKDFISIEDTMKKNYLTKKKFF